MTGYLEKNFILHERDEKEQLIPIDYPVPELDGKIIKIIPLTRGEILRMVAKRKERVNKLVQENLKRVKENQDLNTTPSPQLEQLNSEWEDFVIEHILIPKFTRDDFKFAKLITIEQKLKGVDGKEEVVKRTKDIVDILTDAIYTVSGLDMTEEEAEDELKKK